MAPICEAVFVPVFWWCSEAVGRTRGGCLASLGTSRPQPVGHQHQLSQPPPVVPRQLYLLISYLPLKISLRPGRTYPRLSRSGRCTPREDRLRRCFLHAASYNVIITASIPGEGGEHLESELEWGEQWVVPPELNIN